MTDLYRHYDKDDNLLYVGISISTLQRLGQHRNNARWFDSISRIEIEKCPDRAAALKSEAKAIIMENPAYNIQHSTSREKTSRAKEHFDPNRYTIIHRDTGEEVPISELMTTLSMPDWETVNPSILCGFISIAGTEAGKVLAHLIAERTSKNLILGTHKKVAEGAGVSSSLVSKVYGALMRRGMLKKVRNGCYFLNPEIICYGKKIHGAMLLRLWGEV